MQEKSIHSIEADRSATATTDRTENQTRIHVKMPDGLVTRQPKPFSEGRNGDDFSVSGAGADTHRHTHQTTPNTLTPIPYRKINSKWIIHLNVKHKL